MCGEFGSNQEHKRTGCLFVCVRGDDLGQINEIAWYEGLSFHAKNGISIHAFSLQAYCDRHLWKAEDKMSNFWQNIFFLLNPDTAGDFCLLRSRPVTQQCVRG